VWSDTDLGPIGRIDTRVGGGLGGGGRESTMHCNICFCAVGVASSSLYTASVKIPYASSG
jgi:hypothetical protein